ncbi:hypothetical protein Tco_0697663 [Tanacetum coccineum]
MAISQRNILRRFHGMDDANGNLGKALRTRFGVSKVAFVSHSKAAITRLSLVILCLGLYSTSSNNIPEREVPAGFVRCYLFTLAKQSEDLDLCFMKTSTKMTEVESGLMGTKPVGFGNKKELGMFQATTLVILLENAHPRGNDGKIRERLFYQESKECKKKSRSIRKLLLWTNG